MKSYILSLFFITSFFTGCKGQTAKDVETIPAFAFAEKIKATPNAQILDVRTPGEYSGEHLDNAINVDWNGDNFVANTQKFDKSKPVFVYCKVGGRSKLASDKLHELGFKKIYDLQGGIMKWNAAGFGKPSDKIVGMCSQEFGELLNTDKKVLISFYADWCAPCKQMAPFMLKMQKDLADKITMVRLNADENKTLITDLKVDDLPTLLLYQNKKVVWKHSGFISEQDLKKQLQ